MIALLTHNPTLYSELKYHLKKYIIYIKAPLTQPAEYRSYEPKVMGSNPIRSI